METVTQIGGYINGGGSQTSPAGVPIPVSKPDPDAGLNWGSILSDGLNLGQTAFAMFAGERNAQAALKQSQIQARALELSAQEELLTAQQEQVRGKQDANNIMDQMIQTIASQRLASAANGVDLGFGTPVSTSESARNLADLQLGINRQDTVIRSLARRRQALALREDAMNTRASGKDKASSARMNAYGDVFASVGSKIMREKNRG